ncbi:MAG TPA: NAD(P)/FAD-dependent oxidoreductase [Methylomirabilota bacterium]|jgi:NADH dehydrogenase FAD-containing subunit|nr:NAD(P)/FAD-dependent oxidoreductase [Methylomirabilota bacterium]
MRVVVLGGGFAGMEAVRVLERRRRRRSDVDILLVSDRNYLLFTPLLPQVASSMVEPRHIIQPLRDIRGNRGFRFRRDTVESIDFDGRRVIMAEGSVRYDRLIIAMGGVTPTFNIPGVEEHALNYKWLDDASVLRDHVIDLAEHADHEPDPEVRRRLLTVCVVGGGYTGVELIAELQDLFHSYIVPRYRGIDPGDYRLLVIEAGTEILRGVHPTLAERARRKLWREGIEIRTGTRVTRVLQGAVEAGGEVIPVGLTVWAAGVAGHPVLARVDAERDRLGRLLTLPTMQLKAHPDVYGAGDAVAIEGKPDASIPIIPAALAHAQLAAENIIAELEGRPLGRIEFAPQGMLVSLGERDAVVEVFGLRFSGYLAWLFWNALHLWKLVGFRKQLQVAVDWGLAQIFPRDTAIMRRVSGCAVCAHRPTAARQAGEAA